mmetsp:Transcript_12600/g.29826  ORF Transcript_12600/g.29826 Transcript_12600/m.29826 type:complete len:256 (+) Transcript_12600:223-990(+)
MHRMAVVGRRACFCSFVQSSPSALLVYVSQASSSSSQSSPVLYPMTAASLSSLLPDSPLLPAPTSSKTKRRRTMVAATKTKAIIRFCHVIPPWPPPLLVITSGPFRFLVSSADAMCSLTMMVRFEYREHSLPNSSVKVSSGPPPVMVTPPPYSDEATDRSTDFPDGPTTFVSLWLLSLVPSWIWMVRVLRRELRSAMAISPVISIPAELDVFGIVVVSLCRCLRCCRCECFAFSFVGVVSRRVFFLLLSCGWWKW